VSQSNRLTRQELTWLLAQEARSAARTLRRDVAVLSQAPPPMPVPNGDVTTINVESSLSALDDAVRMLASLHQGGGGARGHRGRFDLAALLCEVAPGARVHIAPGGGTEVIGDEADLRRMLQVLLSQTAGRQAPQGREAPDVRVERHGAEIRVSVSLGPDTMASTGPEHAWLSRMATRHGGRVELEGRQESLVFPAEIDQDKSEVDALRKELAEAQRQGEAYARELAAAFSAGEPAEMTPAAPSTIPPAVGSLRPMLALANAAAAGLRATVASAAKEMDSGALRSDPAALHEALQRRLAEVNETAADLARFGKVAADELPAHVDLAALARETVSDADARATRHGVQVQLEVPSRLEAFVRPTAVRALARALLDQGIAASSRGATVVLSMATAPGAVILTVDDAGASVPVASRHALVWRRVEPTSLGRPGGVHLVCAATLATHLDGLLELDDAPQGGCRTRVRVPVL
jgi:signal transduction histidine kinase